MPDEGLRAASAELLAAIIARPQDLEARLVWADMLSAQGDPRGEFIALQCQPDPSEPQKKRLALLRRLYAQAWTGSLWPLVVSNEVRFVRGTLHSIALRRAPLWEQREIELNQETALLARVRVVSMFVPEERSLIELLPHLPGLRAVEDIDARELVSLLEAGTPLTDVQLAPSPGGPDPLVERIRLPGLERFSLHARDAVEPVAGLLRRHPTLRRLDVGPGNPGRWIRALRGRDALALTVRIPGWTLVASGTNLRHLDIWRLPGVEPHPARALSDALEQFEIAELEFVHVRTGAVPDRQDLLQLQRSAKGTPLLLPARWRIALRG